MNQREIRQYNMFGRVEIFGKDNAADFEANTKAATYFAQIGRIIDDLDKVKVNQKAASSTVRGLQVDALVVDLKNIIRTARAIAQDEPGFADRFRLPDRRYNSVLTAADVILAELKKPGIADKLVAHDIPKELIEHLSTNRQAIAAAQDAKESGKAVGIESTAMIARLIAEGVKTVTYLDAIVHTKYSGNPEKLRAWGSASAVERKARREKTAPAEAAAATA